MGETPKTFASETPDICLYKMHGSVMWYRSDRGSYIKLPVMTEKSEIKLITGEKAWIPLGHLKPLLVENFAEFIRTRKGMIANISEDMHRVFALIDSIRNYLEPFGEMELSLENI